MAKRNLPTGFRSWIQFHDYLKKTKPELFKAKTIRYMQYTENGGVQEAYSVSIACLERQCWREIESLRLGVDQTYEALSSIICSTSDVEDKAKTIEFLKKIQKD